MADAANDPDAAVAVAKSRRRPSELTTRTVPSRKSMASL
jgi:hypothetical protein